MSTSRIRWFFLASVVLSAAVAWGLALPLAGAAVLAFVSEGPIDFVLKKLNGEQSMRLRWAVSAAFVFLLVIGLLLPLTFAATGAISELIALLSGVDWDNAATLGTGSIEWVRQRAASYGLDLPESEITGRVRGALTGSFAFLGTRLGALISSTPTVVFDVVIVFAAWVTFAVQGRAARDRVLPHLLPWKEEREILRKTTAEVLRSVLVANVMVSIAQATICSVALVIVQAPRALVWGTLSFFLSFVPVVGTMPITFGAAVYCYTHDRVGAAVFMVAIAAVIGLVDNILRPVFMKSSANLSFLWTFVAFVGGVALLGLPGVIVGPLAFSLFIAYLRAMEEQNGGAGEGALAKETAPAPSPPRAAESVRTPSVPPISAGRTPMAGRGKSGKKKR
jgi:predicted PurR-regulated permease PerM